MLVPAAAGHHLLGRVFTTVPADRAKAKPGWSPLDVRRADLPRRGNPGAAHREPQRGARLRQLVKWRIGSEPSSHISGATTAGPRTCVDGIAATQAWWGWAVLGAITPPR